MSEQKNSMTLDEARLKLALETVSTQARRHATELIEARLNAMVEIQNLQKQVEQLQNVIRDLSADKNDPETVQGDVVKEDSDDG